MKQYDPWLVTVVEDNLNNAYKENAYYEIVNWTAQQLLYDLQAYSTDFEDETKYSESDALELIAAWQLRNNKPKEEVHDNK